MWGTPQGMAYLATGQHDMRKWINSLVLAVADTLGLDPVSPRLQAILSYQHGRDE